MNKEVNPYMITIAHQARRKNQSMLASEIGIKQARLSKIEAGIAPIDADLLNKISTILDFPIEFFYENYTLLILNINYIENKLHLNKENWRT